jgi:hypothetical protein
VASSPSRAYVEFRAALRQADALLRYERTLSDPPPSDAQALAEGLRGGAIVLMVAAFEGFLRDVFEERLDALGRAVDADSFERLPDRLQVAAVYNLLEQTMHGAPGKPVADQRKDRLADIRAAAAAVADKCLLGSAFSSTASNPSAATVKRMFKQIDCNDVFRSVHWRFVQYWRSPQARAFPARQLDHLVNARHQVAHGENVLAWSRDDLRAAERLVRILARSLDDELRVHVNKIRRAG